MTLRFGDVVRYSDAALDWCKSEDLRGRISSWRGVVLETSTGWIVTEDGQEFQPWELALGEPQKLS